jgi:hypothetical protein
VGIASYFMMNVSLLDQLSPHFVRFRQGRLSPEALGVLLQETGRAHASPLSDLLEQTASRIDLIVLGVCEAERNEQIAGLLHDLEVRLGDADT